MRILASIIAFFALTTFAFAQDAGVLPVGADGKPLNLDFETGTLKDWTLEGDAFKGQPIKGDTVYARRKDNKSEHQGQYWIGGYENCKTSLGRSPVCHSRSRILGVVPRRRRAVDGDLR